MQWKWDTTRRKWHERLVVYDRVQGAWRPWHWRVWCGVPGQTLTVRTWFGLGR
jgi:hypothetical protein